MNLGSMRNNVLFAAFACLIAGGVWSGLSNAGPSTDTDSDTVLDYQDNCNIASNTSQTDTNSDGYGNTCDFDYDNNGTTGASDLTAFKLQFGLDSNDAGYNADMDSDDNNTVGASDLTSFKLAFGGPPGPSSCVPTACI